MFEIEIGHNCGAEFKFQGLIWPPVLVVCPKCFDVLGVKMFDEKEVKFVTIGTLKK